MRTNHMKKGLTVVIIALFIGVAVAPLIQGTVIERSNLPILDGNTLYVGGDGPGNYISIQAAIDDASEGDTVFVYDDSSPYYETVGYVIFIRVNTYTIVQWIIAILNSKTTNCYIFSPD